MAWIFNDGSGTTVDVNAAALATHVYRLKELLKLAGWTHEASSDGTNVSNTSGNANDQIGSSGEMATNNAWFVLSQPAIAKGIGYPGNRQIIIRRGTSDANWLIAYVPPNTDGTKQAKTANGTTTAIPTFTTTQIQLGTLPDTAANWSGVASKNWSFGADNAAPYGFFFVGWQTTGGPPDTGGHFLFDFIVPGTGDPDDKDPCVIFAPGNSGKLGATGTGAIAYLGGAQGATAHGPFCYWRRGLTGEAYSNAALAVLGVWDQVATSFTPVLPAGLSRDSQASGAYNELPQRALYVAGGEASGAANNGSAGKVGGIKGASYMVRWRSGAQPLGYMLTEFTTKDRCVYGDITLPHDGSTTIAMSA